MAWDQYNSGPEFGPKANVSSRLLLETKSQILYCIKTLSCHLLSIFVIVEDFRNVAHNQSINGPLFQQFIPNALKLRFHYLDFRQLLKHFFSKISDPSGRSLLSWLLPRATTPYKITDKFSKILHFISIA